MGNGASGSSTIKIYSWTPVTDLGTSHEIAGNWLPLSAPCLSNMVEFEGPHSGDVTSSDGSRRFVKAGLL